MNMTATCSSLSWRLDVRLLITVIVIALVLLLLVLIY
jgi:hypothetical protein